MALTKEIIKLWSRIHFKSLMELEGACAFAKMLTCNQTLQTLH